MPPRLMDEIAALKIGMVGLPEDAADKYPGAAFGRHAQARRARPRAGARPGDPLSRRADRRARPDRRRRLRPADPRSAEQPRADRVHGDARSRQPVRDLRPGRGAGRQEDPGRHARRACCRTTIPGSIPISTGRAAGRRARRSRRAAPSSGRRPSRPEQAAQRRRRMETRAHYVAVGAFVLVMLVPRLCRGAVAGRVEFSQELAITTSISKDRWPGSSQRLGGPVQRHPGRPGDRHPRRSATISRKSR